MEDEKLTRETEEIFMNLYNAYGSGTGVLFGIPSELKTSVASIIKIIIKDRRSKKDINDAIDDMSCCQAPDVCQCCQNLDALKEALGTNT